MITVSVTYSVVTATATSGTSATIAITTVSIPAITFSQGAGPRGVPGQNALGIADWFSPGVGDSSITLSLIPLTGSEIMFVDGAIQDPDTAYVISSDTITLSGWTFSGTERVCVYYQYNGA